MMMIRGFLLAATPLVLIPLAVWADKAGIEVPDPLTQIAWVGIYLASATGIMLLPFPRTPKCILGVFYTVAIVPGMIFAGLLTSCAMGDCI